MEKIALILAAGNALRFNNTLKQLLPIGDELIIDRIIRQIDIRTIREDIDIFPLLITHNQEIVDAANIQMCQKPKANRWTCETLLSTVEWWNKRVIVLLGDVIYSKAVMDRIINCQDEIRVFGHEYEIFAISFTSLVKAEVILALSEAIRHAMARGPGTLRKFYQAYCGLDLNSDKMEDEVLDRICFLQDYTNDIDTQEDYDNFLKQKLHLLDDLT